MATTTPRSTRWLTVPPSGCGGDRPGATWPNLSSPAIAASMVPVFLVLAVVGAVPLLVYFRDLAASPTRPTGRR
jgi:hypothetical protein